MLLRSHAHQMSANHEEPLFFTSKFREEPDEEEGYTYKTDTQILQEGGWSSMHNFMSSFGLKQTPEGYAEAKLIIDGFRRMDEQMSDTDTWHDDVTARYGVFRAYSLESSTC